jgi:hypothetical protein
MFSSSFKRNGQGLYTAFSGGLCAAQPVANRHTQNASDRPHAKVQRAKRKKEQTARHAQPLPRRETNDAKEKIQQQSPAVPAARRVIQRADQKGDHQSKQNNGKGYHGTTDSNALFAKIGYTQTL